MADLKRSLERKEKSHKKLKLERGAATDVSTASKTKATRVVKECAEKVCDSNSPSSMNGDTVRD